jgi:hypothetical protein
MFTGLCFSVATKLFDTFEVLRKSFELESSQRNQLPVTQFMLKPRAQVAPT